MKLIKFKAKANGKTVRGCFHSQERPNRAQTIAERICGCRLTNFMFVVKNVKENMIKCEVED